ncbi:MAG: helix-turn-helix domain-containing protein [Solirubrobacteraceae bacterium]
MNRLREYRERHGWSQEEVIAEIHRRALQRGDPVAPGLDQPALSRHENGHKRPGPRNRDLYCLVYGATPAELGFCLALPDQERNHEDVDRRGFLAGAAGLAASLALPDLPAPTRLGEGDIARLRHTVSHLYKLDDLHGAGSVYALATRTFNRLRSLTERASYNPATGQAIRELAALTAEHAGWLAFDAGQHDEARRWWLESMHWARLANADSVSVMTMASMSIQASDQGYAREAINLATAAQRSAKASATPRLTSVLLAREALGHAGDGNATSARSALRRARGFVDQTHDDDPSWITVSWPANFASNECRVALTLGDTVAAQEAARTALALNDPLAYPRNHAVYMIQLADVLARRRKIDESAAVATRAAVAAADLDSGRVTRGLRAVAKRLEPHRGNADVGAFLALY